MKEGCIATSAQLFLLLGQLPWTWGRIVTNCSTTLGSTVQLCSVALIALELRLVWGAKVTCQEYAGCIWWANSVPQIFKASHLGIWQCLQPPLATIWGWLSHPSVMMFRMWRSRPTTLWSLCIHVVYFSDGGLPSELHPAWVPLKTLTRLFVLGCSMLGQMQQGTIKGTRSDAGHECTNQVFLPSP